jgi:ABC-2 type transport system permease protein
VNNPVADSWRRLRAAAWARSLEFVRDRAAMSWNLVFPVLLVLGLAYMFSGPGQPIFKVAVLAPDGVALDAQLHPFLNTPQVQFYREAQRDPALHKVQLQRIDMLIDFTGTSGRYWVNDQSSKGSLLEQLMRGAGGEPLQREFTSGAQVRYVDWVAPGVLAMSMMFSCLFGIGYVIVRYRKSGYLKRLNATPLRAFRIPVGAIALTSAAGGVGQHSGIYGLPCAAASAHGGLLLGLAAADRSGRILDDRNGIGGFRAHQ